MKISLDAPRSQPSKRYPKPIEIVDVGGPISRLVFCFFVNPVLYEVVARDADLL
jgi:hypothetical protein